MAFATLTFPTMIFDFDLLVISSGSKKLEFRKSKKNSGFRRFYGYLLNGEVLSMHRSFFFH
jgi:hypothetical protein